MRIQENVPLKDHCTIGIGGPGRYFSVVKTPDEIVEAVEFAGGKNIPFFVLGKGSNIIFSDNGFNGLIIKNELLGVELNGNIIKAAAGEIWDDVVARSVEENLSGIEAMSAIPGTVGATPVQNVGAYGQEIKDTLVELEAYDAQNNIFVTLTNSDCGFSYRNSIFKTSAKGRYIITSVTLLLKRETMQPPFYASLQKYLDQNNITEHSPFNIRQAVTTIRTSKLPDPSQIPNVGSFFKNPIIDKAQFTNLESDFPNIVNFPTPYGRIKLGAGWLIEHSGILDREFKNFALHNDNSLVLTRTGIASFADLLAVKEAIVDAVQTKFGITLEQEPETVL